MKTLTLKKHIFIMSIGAMMLSVGVGILGSTSCGKAIAAGEDALPSAFKYREIYLPEGIGENAQHFGLNTLDEDWGIWGHNLGKVLPKDPSQSVFAKVNGVASKKQFCFSSNHLFEYVEDYIIDNFGTEETIRFAIIPNDNEIVCLCEKCVIAGNTRKNASPAVNKLVIRLAERFPNHIFYTADYKTTRELPVDSMPKNTGVLVSAINFPLSYEESPEETNFIQRLQAWGQTTPRILVWDYINNFDDYFTPYPTFGAMQRRLKDYRDNNVTAIFLNGSGENISTMSRLKTAVLSEMTRDPETDWKELIYEKAAEYYPTAGKIIADFMVAQEEDLEQSGNALPLYEGVAVARKIYLPEDKFIPFHDQLLALRPSLSGQEREYIDILLGELALTRLELNRINGNFNDSERFLNELDQLSKKGFTSYNESGLTIDAYINDYRYILDHLSETSSKNKLKGESLVAMTPLDPDYSDISIITDGALGIPSNYHNGNLIISPDVYARIAVPNKPGLNRLKVWLSYNPAAKVGIPERVTLSASGKELAAVSPDYPRENNGHLPIEFDVPDTAEGTLLLTFYKGEDTKSIAIEEIEGF